MFAVTASAVFNSAGILSYLANQASALPGRRRLPCPAVVLQTAPVQDHIIDYNGKLVKEAVAFLR